jgi:hypothetical protein
MSSGASIDAVMAESPTEPREIIVTCRAAWGAAYASQSEGTGVDETALAVYNASCEKLEELGYSVEERPAELEIILVEGESPYDGEIWVDPAAFLDLGAVCLNELTEIVDVRPVREKNACCALVPHKAKEGSQWWKICGGTGSHTHQGKNFCGRHQLHYRTQEKTGKVPIFTTETVACSSHSREQPLWFGNFPLFESQLLDCTLHPDRWWWRLLSYIPDVLYILYIRVVPPGMGMAGPAC